MSLSLGFLNAKLFFCLCVTFLKHHFTFSASNPTGLTLRAVLDDSSGSPLYLIENLTIAERIERLIKVTNARANYLSLVSNCDARIHPDNIPMPILREGLFYVVEFAIGSQHHKVKLLMDTGGGLIWTQCVPCKTCFPQNLPIFNPSASATYARLPCDHPLCKGPGDRYTCFDGFCVYNVHYTGGASTRGTASMETFHFSIDESEIESFKNVIFGCSDDSSDIFFRNTDISGIFGLSMSPDSMMIQFSSFIHSRFSYCLVPFADAIPRPLVLRFGEDIPQLPLDVRTTSFVQSPTNHFYYLELWGISVAGHRLPFSQSTFQYRANGKGGCFIDSGALFTQIDAGTVGINAYAAVMQVFASYYESKSLRRTTSRGFELCYERPPNYDDFASLTFHFNGADYTVAGEYVNLISPDIFCVAIIKGTYATMLGAWQQQNKRLIYDVGMGALQFAEENCVNDVS
ncbi:hypothetical protein Goklo_001299 [Gossypium klotzschianum]|uniref:Peptidase A1 domain-containing protein n=1 Tax=Gossypium klotzschianum TaxID=34286 RepID=A0A7J8W051_9ROSI|nr:hypothetical protein [Gossypium klotzschianum]